MRLERASTALVIIDVQEKLMPVIDRREAVELNISRLVSGAHLLGIPILVTEQYVKGLGATVSPVRETLENAGGYRPIEKDCFSAHGCAPFRSELEMLNRRQVVVAGIETHVCVYQTVTDLLKGGYDVTIVADAVSSRTAENREIALRRVVSEGARLSSTEMTLFELVGTSGTDEFRAISKLIR
ncbi:MAG TPA: hydrolase [Thermoanaerobaculia bacterium]